MTQLKQITNPRYDDIDSTFGLHDYEVNLELRNSRKSFIHETFRKVFTKNVGKPWTVF